MIWQPSATSWLRAVFGLLGSRHHLTFLYFLEIDLVCTNCGNGSGKTVSMGLGPATVIFRADVDDADFDFFSRSGSGGGLGGSTGGFTGSSSGGGTALGTTGNQAEDEHHGQGQGEDSLDLHGFSPSFLGRFKFWIRKADDESGGCSLKADVPVGHVLDNGQGFNPDT